MSDEQQAVLWVVTWGLAALGVAYAMATAGARLAGAAFVKVSRRDVDWRDPEVRRAIRVVRWTAFAALTAIFCLPALRLAGMDLQVGLSPETLTAWLFGSGLRIAVIAIASYFVLRIISLVSRRLEDEIGREAGPDILERVKRARTLSRLVGSAMTVLVVSIAALMILRELRVDITPILTGAGILGLAVGFGGQALVRDIISGFFLIVENQIRVGDVAVINGTGGLVEEINLRTVVLRDYDGTVHIFPNGSITQLSNRTKDYSYYVADVGVSYRHDTDEVIGVLREVGDDLYADEKFRPHILEPLEIAGVEAFRESHVGIRMRIKTIPLKQWDVGRELLRRIKKAFDEHGIEIPAPRMVVQNAPLLPPAAPGGEPGEPGLPGS
jgi:small-conductance mechanosensitive channel